MLALEHVRRHGTGHASLTATLLLHDQVAAVRPFVDDRALGEASKR